MSEALKFAETLEKMRGPYLGDGINPGVNAYQLAAELRRLHAENEALRAAYRKMRDAAAGYSNYCEDSASVRRCERDMEQAESMYHAIDAARKESI